jgi:cytosine/adenosine deaminase-related metal-dependent hydrolase
MADLIVAGGRVLTQNADREVIDDGAVAVEGTRVVDVGPTAEVADRVGADRRIDADGRAVLPGLVNPHTHVADVLTRGAFAGDRTLYDWLYNVKQPALHAMEPRDHELAAALYCTEALGNGVTTFVENDAELPFGGSEDEQLAAKMDVYAGSGMRVVYGRGVRDRPPGGEFADLVERIQLKAEGVHHPPQSLYTAETDEWVASLESLFDTYHGGADGRISVWPAPVVVEGMTAEGLRAAYRFAEERDVMTTTHVAEVAAQSDATLSAVEFLDNAGALGEHSLLAHCVHVDDRDLRRIARTGARVSHNVLTNMALGSGFAPVQSMLEKGVTVAVGTDNSSLSDTVDPLTDARVASMAHRAHHRDPGQVPAQRALDMVTRDAARAIGRGDDLGSLEAGKRADLVVLDLDRPGMAPLNDLVRALAYRASGADVETVVCDGRVVVDDGRVVTLAPEYPDLRSEATEAAARVLDRSGVGVEE